MKAHTRTWRAGAKPCRDLTFAEHDRDLLDDYDLPDILLHARKCLGLIPYSMAEVKPAVSAHVIYQLVGMLWRLRDSKSVKAMTALRAENARLKSELAVCRREMQRWGLEYPGSREKRTELPARLDAPA